MSSPPPPPITLVRWPNRDAAEILAQFVSANRFAGRRAPRGLDPEYVSFWLRENIQSDCAPAAMMRVVDLLRFYERKDVIEHTSRFLTRNEADERSFRRAMYVVQAIGEVGTPEQAAFAVRYFNEFLLPQPIAMDFFALVLETAEALASAIDVTVIGRRLQAALAAAAQVENLDGAAGLPWRKYSDYNRNNLPNTVAAIEAKRRLLYTPPAQRLQELLLIYLGVATVSSPSMEIWAGRMIRQFAIDDGQPAVVGALSQIINAALSSEMEKPQKDFFIHRAGQAAVYLQGKLEFPQQAALDAVKAGTENFLCDDLN
ncbi:MAG: hypothetical protein JNM66_21440 [Bryobacterales bacterium]|nr:hypothetical protein [Bryobacterales bacterium]